MPLIQDLASADLISREYLEPSISSSTISSLPIDSLTAEELDALPFGTIQLSAYGTILQYNQYESTLAHLPKSRAIGKNFFTEIAPCANVQEFHGKFMQGVSKKQLHEKFRFRFTFKPKPRDVSITLFYSEITDTVWVFIKPV